MFRFASGYKNYGSSNNGTDGNKEVKAVNMHSPVDVRPDHKEIEQKNNNTYVTSRTKKRCTAMADLQIAQP